MKGKDKLSEFHLLGTEARKVKTNIWWNVLFLLGSRKCVLDIKVKPIQNCEGKLLPGPWCMQKQTGSCTCQARVTSCFLPYHEYTVMDTYITGQLIGSLGYLISRCDHSRKTAFPSLLFIVFCVSHLEGEKRK